MAKRADELGVRRQLTGDRDGRRDPVTMSAIRPIEAGSFGMTGSNETVRTPRATARQTMADISAARVRVRSILIRPSSGGAARASG